MFEPTAPPLRLAIIGAGRAGRRFARQCLLYGQPILLEDVLPAKLRTAEAELAQHVPELATLVSLVTSVEDAVREADLAIDFVPDELESKLEIFSLIDRMAPPRTILLTPTDVLSIADLASCTYRPDRCFALRRDAPEIPGPQRGSAWDHDQAWERGLLLAHPEAANPAALRTVQDLLARLHLPHTTALDHMPTMLTGR